MRRKLRRKRKIFVKVIQRFWYVQHAGSINCRVLAKCVCSVQSFCSVKCVCSVRSVRNVRSMWCSVQSTMLSVQCSYTDYPFSIPAVQGDYLHHPLRGKAGLSRLGFSSLLLYYTQAIIGTNTLWCLSLLYRLVHKLVIKKRYYNIYIFVSFTYL